VARSRYLLFVLLLVAHASSAAPRQLDDHHWRDVGRIVAIGDLHGDYDSYMTVLQAAGVVDRRGRWIAGDTHLVQTGDIPDRGPDTRRIITHMARLAVQATKRGGRVHNLMGNHEAMNVYGDLRYVSDGEFRAFAGKRSAALRDRYYTATMEALAASDPERAAALPPGHRQQWDLEHPLGWVEHRFAWDPQWDAKGALYLWTMSTRVAVQLNDLVFVHGGISSRYCGNSLQSMTAMAHAALQRRDPDAAGILRDEAGPLWYRGLAGVAPAARLETVDAILERHGARHLVIGHTPTDGVVWPRLGGRVIQIDTGMGAAYGKHIGWLEATSEGLFAGYRDGRLRLPIDDGERLGYLDAVIAMHPGNLALAERRALLRAGTLDPPPASVAERAAETLDAAASCGTSR
jgi:hypothetical protein